MTIRIRMILKKIQFDMNRTKIKNYICLVKSLVMKVQSQK